MKARSELDRPTMSTRKQKGRNEWEVSRMAIGSIGGDASAVSMQSKLSDISARARLPREWGAKGLMHDSGIEVEFSSDLRVVNVN